MRKTIWLWPSLLAVAIVLSPGVSEAKGFGRGGGGHSGSHGSAPAPTRRYGTAPGGRSTYYFQGNGSRAYGPGYRPGYGPGYRYGYAGVRPYWGYYAGWGIWPWGYYAYGYYPYWGAPPVDQGPESRSPKTSSFTLFGGGGLTSQGFTPSGSFSFDGRRWGVNFQGIGLVSEPASAGQDRVYMPLVSGHLAFSLVSNPHFRWRVEGGASAIFAPAATYVGPDFGTSAQLAIAGPFGLQAAVHYTPTPAKIIDAEANAVLSFGGLGVKAGWRVIRLDDRDVRGAGTGGLDLFSGPMVSLGFMY